MCALLVGTLVSLVFASIIPLAAPQHTVSCNTNCDDWCRLPIVNTVEPGCRASCEVHRLASCKTGQALPDPFPPLPGPQSGAVFFDKFTSLVEARCGLWEGRANDMDVIEKAVQALKSNRIIGANEFDGVQTRWCPLGGADGFTPQRNTIDGRIRPEECTRGRFSRAYLHTN